MLADEPTSAAAAHTIEDDSDFKLVDKNLSLLHNEANSGQGSDLNCEYTSTKAQAAVGLRLGGMMMERHSNRSEEPSLCIKCGGMKTHISAMSTMRRRGDSDSLTVARNAVANGISYRDTGIQVEDSGMHEDLSTSDMHQETSK